MRGMSLLALLPFLVIEIDIDPVIGEVGPFTLTWHGLFTALGIIAGVSLSVWLAKRDGIPSEVAQEVALVGVPCAIVGARLLYVAEHWSDFSGSGDEFGDIIFGITEGGITLYGGLIGGVLGGLAYVLWRNRQLKKGGQEDRQWPIPLLLDAAAPGMILGQALGRIGDLINGEHWAKESDLPWAVRYVHPETLGEIGVAVHPVAGGYEMLGDFIILGLLLFVIRRVFAWPGWVFCTYMVLYGTMRFFLSFLRTNSGTGGEQTFFDIPVPQLIAGITVGLGILLAGFFLRYPGRLTKEYRERTGWKPREDDAGQPRPAASP